MSGTRDHNYRQGDRSEYFAQVLLSGLGLCTPIPRQEDIGFDFVCNISDQESGVLTFGSPYVLTVKSKSKPVIKLEPTAAAIKENSQRHIDWLFREELPAFLAIVDKKAFTMSFYSLIPLWFIYYEGGLRCGGLSIIPRIDSTDTSDVTRPADKGEIQGWRGMNHFEVDLGHPVASVDLETLKDPEKTKSVKGKLRKAIHFAQLNRVHYRLKVPYFYWFAKTTPDSSETIPAYYHLDAPLPPEERQRTLKALFPSLIALALLYKHADDKDSLEAIKTLVRELPLDIFPEGLKGRLPEIIPAAKA